MVNVLSVVVVAMFTFIMGWLWYSPVLFGDTWMKILKLKKQDMQPSPGTMVLNVASTFLSMAILAVFILLTNAVTFGEGATIGVLLWLGFAAPVQFGAVLWEKKPMKFFWINTGYSLVTLLVAGGILAVW